MNKRYLAVFLCSILALSSVPPGLVASADGIGITESPNQGIEISEDSQSDSLGGSSGDTQSDSSSGSSIGPQGGSSGDTQSDSSSNPQGGSQGDSKEPKLDVSKVAELGNMTYSDQVELLNDIESAPLDDTGVPASNFVFYLDKVETSKPEGFEGLVSGPIESNLDKLNTYFPGYVFDTATYEGNVVLAVGVVHWEDKDYVYYETKDSESSPIYFLLDMDALISLNYKRIPIDISYSVEVDGQSILPNSDNKYVLTGKEFGSDKDTDVVILDEKRPPNVHPGDDYAFKVTIPRGYKASVVINDNKVLTPELGTSPNYIANGDGSISKEDPSITYTTSSFYKVNADTDIQSVKVKLQKQNQFNFSATQISGTQYFGNGSRVISTSVNGTNGWSGSFSGSEVSWVFETEKEFKHSITGSSYPDPKWVLNVLQMNEVDLKLPFVDGEVATTILPSGSMVEISRARKTDSKWETVNGVWGPYKSTWFVYTVTVKNCYENLTITGGNLHSWGDKEFMPYEFVGVDTFEYNYGGEYWYPGYISQPIGGDMVGGNKFRFTLKPGYGNPKFDINGTDIPVQEVDGYYVASIDPNLTSTILITIKAEPVDFNVNFLPGSVSDAQDLPPTEVHSISKNKEMMLPNMIPTDPSGVYKFVGWVNGDVDSPDAHVFKSGELVQFSDLSMIDGKIDFVAKWVLASEAQTVDIDLEFWNSDNNTKLDTDLVTHFTVPRGTALVLQFDGGVIKDYLDSNKYFEIDLDKTTRIYMPNEIPENEPIKVWLKERVTEIVYKAVAPDTDPPNMVAGYTAPSAETVKVKSDVAAGAKPVPAWGYVFEGWFKDPECKVPVTDADGSIDESGKFIPIKQGEYWTDVTKSELDPVIYYARFEVGYGDLTLESGAVDGVFGDQEFIYRIQGLPSDIHTNGVDFEVVAKAGEVISLRDLPAGNYTVTELGDWSWRFGEANKSLKLGLEGGSIQFPHSLQNKKWFSKSVRTKLANLLG